MENNNLFVAKSLFILNVTNQANKYFKLAVKSGLWDQFIPVIS